MTGQPLQEFDEKKIEQAQQSLVNTTIALALDMIVEQCERNGKPLINTFVPYKNADGTPLQPKEVKAELYKVLTETENEYLRLRRLNLVARENQTDISLKSSGAKTEESVRDKILRRHMSFDDVTDYARITVVSGNLEFLDKYADDIKRRIHDEQNPAPQKEDMEPWKMRDRGLLHKVLKTQVADINSEVQFVPRQQARISTRVTHKFSIVDRDMDVLEELQKSDPAEAPKKQQSLLKDYNALVGVIGRILEKPTLDDDDLKAINKALASKDYSKYAFDEASEGAAKAGRDYKRKIYSPMFKNLSDLQTYADYLRKVTPDLGVTNLKPIAEKAGVVSPEQLQLMRHNMLSLAQATHFCYMVDAPEPMRNLFIEKAYALNQTKGREFIPKVLIDTVPHTVKPLAEGQQRG
jgi:hypothetical protein